MIYCFIGLDLKSKKFKFNILTEVFQKLNFNNEIKFETSNVQVIKVKIITAFNFECPLSNSSSKAVEDYRRGQRDSHAKAGERVEKIFLHDKKVCIFTKKLNASEINFYVV